MGDPIEGAGGERSARPADPARRDHSFGQERVRPGEGRTLLVIAITASMMVIEIVAGIAFGSMALLADGLHMASHAAALSINAFAYVYARRRAHDRRFSFGTGKVNALGGFAGAVLLAAFAVVMAAESVHRLLQPVPISFDLAIVVAVLGLVVNGVSVFILGAHGGERGHDEHGSHHHDHNLRSAYFHVLADALTSLLAIMALLSGKYLGWRFLDPTMGIVGAILVGRWSIGLVRATSRVLLDVQAPDAVLDRVRNALEEDPDLEVNDLHVWTIGPGIRAAEVVVSSERVGEPDTYRRRIPAETGIEHVVIEVRRKGEGS